MSGTETARCFTMGSGVKWVFCALFGIMSKVKLFHSFEISENPSKLFLVKVSAISWYNF